MLVPPEPNTSCDLVSSSNALLVCLVSLLAGETGKIHNNIYFTGTDNRISVIVLLTVWEGFRTCRMDFGCGFAVWNLT
jgi:hypothetical protein